MNNKIVTADYVRKITDHILIENINIELEHASNTCFLYYLLYVSITDISEETISEVEKFLDTEFGHFPCYEELPKDCRYGDKILVFREVFEIRRFDYSNYPSMSINYDYLNK